MFYCIQIHFLKYQLTSVIVYVVPLKLITSPLVFPIKSSPIGEDLEITKKLSLASSTLPNAYSNKKRSASGFH